MTAISSVPRGTFSASMLELEKHLAVMDRILGTAAAVVQQRSTAGGGGGAQPQAEQRSPPPATERDALVDVTGARRPIVTANRTTRNSRPGTTTAHSKTSNAAAPSLLTSPNVGRTRDAASGAAPREEKSTDRSPPSGVLSFRPRTLSHHIDVTAAAAASYADSVAPMSACPSDSRLHSNPIVGRGSETSAPRTADRSVDDLATDLASGARADGQQVPPHSTAAVPSPAPRGPDIADDSSSRRAKRAVLLPDVSVAWGGGATASTASWRSKIHAKGFLSSIVGILPPCLSGGGSSSGLVSESGVGRDFRREASSVCSRSHSTATATAPLSNSATHHVDPAAVDGSGVATHEYELSQKPGDHPPVPSQQETAAGSLLRRIQQALDPHSRSAGYSRETSYLRATSATDHLASTGGTAASRSASQASRPQLRERASFVSGVRHYAHDSIFERLASVGTQAHPIASPNRTAAQKPQYGTMHPAAFSRSSSLPLADTSLASSFAQAPRPRLPPMSSVAASVVAEPAHAAWVGNLRGPAAPRLGTAVAATSQTTNATAKKGGVGTAQPPAAGATAASRLGGPHRPVTVPAAPPDSIWGRLYGIATKKRRDEQERNERGHLVTTQGATAVSASTVAAVLSGQTAKQPARSTVPSHGNSQLHQSHVGGGRSACPEVVQRLLNHDARHKAEIRHKQQLQEQAEQEKIQREREEIFKKAARFRESQLKHVPAAASAAGRAKEQHAMVHHRFVHLSAAAAPQPTALEHAKRATSAAGVSTSSVKPATGPLPSAVTQTVTAHLSSAAKKVDVAAVVAATTAISAAQRSQKQRYEVDTDDEVGADFVEVDALGLEDAVLSPNGTWHRRTPVGRPPVSPLKRSQSSFRHVPGPIPPLSGNRNAAVSPIEIGPDAFSRKSHNIDKVPHSRTSSYVSVSSPAVTGVVSAAVPRPEMSHPVTPFASRLNDVQQEDAREEVLDVRLGAPRVAASTANRPIVVSSVASLGYLSSLGRSGGGEAGTVAHSSAEPLQQVSSHPTPPLRPATAPVVTPLDFSKLRRTGR